MMEQLAPRPAVEKGSKLFRALGVLERRREMLQERVDAGERSEKSLSYDRSEIEAIDIALDAIRLQWATVKGLDTPILVLEDLTKASRGGSRSELQKALARADEVLEAYE